MAAGCTTLPREGPAPGGFNLRGKLGVVDGTENFSARFLWRQQATAFDIDLWGPLGQGRVQLSGDERTLELRDGDGSVLSRGEPESVMQRHLGWSLPLSVLPHWVRGQPAPGMPASARQRDEAGRLIRFQQLGWEVDLERYQSLDGAEAEQTAPVLPYRITARRDTYRVRLAISEWQI